MLDNLFTLAIIHNYVGHIAAPDSIFRPLPEQVLMHVDAMQNASIQKLTWKVGDPMVGTTALLIHVLIILHRYRWLLYRRWTFILGFVYTLRDICLAVRRVFCRILNVIQAL